MRWEAQLTRRSFSVYEVVLFVVASAVAADVLFNVLAVGWLFRFDTGQHFYYLAQAFLQGKPYFTTLPQSHYYINDVAVWAGRAYWPLGPFPAVLSAFFLPWFEAWFRVPFFSNYLQLVLTVGTGCLVYGVARRERFSKPDAFYLTLSFLCSAFLALAVIPVSYFFAQLVAVFFLWAAIFEYLGRRRYVVLGSYLACVLATRLTAGLAVLFFIAELTYQSLQERKLRWRELLGLAAPFGVAVLALGLYNYVRFASWFEVGYRYQQLFVPPLAQAWAYGQFSFAHLPGNLYYLFLSMPLPVLRDAVSHVLTFPFIQANPWGMSMFFTSPLLLYLFRAKLASFKAQALALTSALIAVPIVLYYGVGFVQFGYRYSFDFLPLLFWLFMVQYRSHQAALSYRMKVLIVTSALLNTYLFTVFLGRLG